MAEELELDLQEEEKENRAQDRIKTLSSKVRDTAQERDEAKRIAEEATAKAEAAEKKAAFLEKFTELAGKHQGATEYRDKIWEKVSSGYEPEDAVVAVLNSEGKLMPQERAPIVESAAGGSSSTVIMSGEKTPDTMTQAERREALASASESGELGQIIRNWGRN